jgi:hypothetical protein
MLPGVRLFAWNLKEPPIAIEYHAVITNPAKFASGTLGELRERYFFKRRAHFCAHPRSLSVGPVF